MKGNNTVSKLITFLKLAKTPRKLVRPMASNGLINWMSDETFIKLVFKASFGYELDLNNPKTFSEKLQWLKLYNRRPEYTMMVDKYRVRDYIREKIGEEYLIPLLNVWNSVEEIDFDSLPNQFVLKCNHDQGSVVICKDKSTFDVEAAKRKLARKLKRNHYWSIREWPYKNVKPCIICEQYMQDDGGKEELSDYKVLCFNGEPKLIEVHRGRFGGGHTQDIYDLNWNKTKYYQPDVPTSDEVMDKPVFAEEMISLSRKLSDGIPHVRVDWYYTNEHLYFSELTFYDGSGFDPFMDNQDLEIGSWLVLPEKYNG